MDHECETINNIIYGGKKLLKSTNIRWECGIRAISERKDRVADKQLRLVTPRSMIPFC